MLKKIAILGMALLLCLSGSISFAENAKTSADFKDLAGVDAALKAKIDALLSKGVFDGVSDDSFGIDENMTRAQFAKVLTLIYGVKVDDSVRSSSFTDVKADDAANGWAIPFIEAAKKAGLLSGMGNNTFDPGSDVTLGQFATGLVRGLGVKPDITGSPWYADSVKQAVERKILPDGTDGSKLATRADLVVGAYGGQQAYEVIKQQAEPSPSPSPSPSPTPTPPPYTPPADTTPPSFTATYPKVGAAQADGSKKVQLLVQADESGTAYYVVVDHYASSPTAAQVMAGNDADDHAALDAGNTAESANVQTSITTIALPADGMSYDVYFVLKDALGNASSTPVKLVVTTPVAVAVTPPADTITGYVVAPGSTPGTTTITYTPDNGNTLRIQISANAISVPVSGADASDIGLLSYVSGDEIAVVAEGTHIGLYEVDSASKVVKFVDIVLSAGDIASSGGPGGPGGGPCAPGDPNCI